MPQQLHVDARAPGDTMTVFHPPRDITPVASVIRWFFSVPQWVQLTGAALAIVVALVALVLVWRNAHAIRDWALQRHRTTPIVWKAIIGLLAVFVLLGMGGSGAAFFVYSQNDNQFCLGCHTLHDEVYERFQQSKHHRIANLRCHDCHDEPLIAETTQIVKWMLLRPSEVGPHAPVPRAVCANCHVKENPDSSWKRIIATAGHSVHLLSDTGKTLGIECLTCHGVTAHRFVPVAQTCAQSGCHDKTKIKLGKMAGQTSLHCVTCHDFTGALSETAGVAAAKEVLTPSAHNCLGCHEMRTAIKRFVPDKDPHKGRCGDCHNPHTQTTPAEAGKTCANSGCHVRPDTISPFHRGLHASALANCVGCHQAHTWKVNGSACADCHGNMNSRPARPAFPPSRSGHTVSMTTDPQPTLQLASVGDPTPLILAALAWLRAPLPPPPQSSDTVRFSHATHQQVSCTACHSASGPTHGSVELRSVRDCESCHHGREVVALGGGSAACLHCHQASTLAQRQPTVTIAVSRASPAPTRTLPFNHGRHTSVACAECHTTPVSLAPAVTAQDCQQCHHGKAVQALGGGRAACFACHQESTLPAGAVTVTVRTSTSPTAMTRTLPFAHAVHASTACAECHTGALLAATATACAGCHVSHHAPSRACSTCHNAYDAHLTQQVHTGCAGSGCHTDRAVLALAPVRNVCLSCHVDKQDHKPGRDCAACHLVHWTPTPPTVPGSPASGTESHGEFQR